ncbi:MAG: hypothetical protein OHK006_00040 [Thermodesulfovibrionales bacterium]
MNQAASLPSDPGLSVSSGIQPSCAAMLYSIMPTDRPPEHADTENSSARFAASCAAVCPALCTAGTAAWFEAD